MMAFHLFETSFSLARADVLKIRKRSPGFPSPSENCSVPGRAGHAEKFCAEDTTRPAPRRARTPDGPVARPSPTDAHGGFDDTGWANTIRRDFAPFDPSIRQNPFEQQG
ncbi:MAG: hypothetical protein QM766_23370 [Burkholderiaceae bacterium]